MSTYQAQASEVIDGRPEQIYTIISDYHEGHPAILPSRYFTDMVVTAGGQGEGTVTKVEMNVFGTKILYNLRVTKSEPGRLLVEEDEEAGVVTTFTLDPINGGEQTRVTITTKARTAPGFRGFVERILNPAITRRIYREELQQLAAVVKERYG